MYSWYKYRWNERGKGENYFFILIYCCWWARTRKKNILSDTSNFNFLIEIFFKFVYVVKFYSFFDFVWKQFSRTKHWVSVGFPFQVAWNLSIEQTTTWYFILTIASNFNLLEIIVIGGDLRAIGFRYKSHLLFTLLFTFLLKLEIIIDCWFKDFMLG